MVGRLRPKSSWGACRSALGIFWGRFHILQQAASSVESVEVMALGDNAIRQRVCMILEIAPCRSRRCLFPGGGSVERIALQMVERVYCVNLNVLLGI
jgi:hypothetical protein